MIITVIALVILSAITIKTLYDNKIIKTASEGAEDYLYEEEREIISDAIYQAMLQSFISETISFDYKQLSGHLAQALNENGQYECEVVNEDDNGYSVYHVKPKGKGFYFVLRMNNQSGQYNLDIVK